MVPQQWRDLQQALEKERASSLKLQTEVNRIRQEMQTAKVEGESLAPLFFVLNFTRILAGELSGLLQYQKKETFIV